MHALLVAPAVFFCFLVAANSFSSLVTWPFSRADSALNSFMCVSLSAADSCACCNSSCSASIGAQTHKISHKDDARRFGQREISHCSPEDLWASSKEMPGRDMLSMRVLLAAHVCAEQAAGLTLRWRQAQASQEAPCLRREVSVVSRGKVALSLLDLGLCAWGSENLSQTSCSPSA